MKIVYLAPIPYDGLRQRPQFLAEGLAREHEVIYVEPTVSMLKSLLKGGLNYRGFSQKVNAGLTICRLNGTWLLPRFLEGVWSGFGMPGAAGAADAFERRRCRLGSGCAVV